MKVQAKINIFSIIIGIIISSLPIYVYYSYVNELKGCACAEDYRQIYIKYAVIGAILFSILTSIMFSYFKHSKIPTHLSVISSLSLSGLLLSYAYSLIKKDCECSESWKRTFMIVHGVLLLIPNLYVVYKSIK